MITNTTKQLVSMFTQDELSALMTGMAGYVNAKRKQGRSTGVETVVFNKIVDALLLSNELNAIELAPTTSTRIGVAEGKVLLANEL